MVASGKWAPSSVGRPEAVAVKVDFMIIGAQKCGTSTLFEILADHPSVVRCRKKEPHFFSSSKDWKKDLPEYEKLFDQRQGALYFEASTSYTFYPLRNLRIWDDIFDYNPNMKFIYLVRDPVDRIISAYMHLYERGSTDLSIEKALIQERMLIDVTRYYTQIYPYVKRFGTSNVLVIDFDDLNRHRKMVLQTISTFLGIGFETFHNYENRHSNASIGGHKRHIRFDNPSLALRALRKFWPSVWNRITDNSRRSFKERPKLTIEYREMIINVLELEINELQKLMNKDLGHWKSLQ
jgi:hypothetical protein